MSKGFRFVATLICALGLGCLPLHTQLAPWQSNQRQQPQLQKTPQKARVMILGVFHFAGTEDVFAAERPDLSAAKNQEAIQEIASRIAQFKPTVVALELPYGSDAPNKTYQEYLEGKHALAANEREQLGFRVAKLVGLKGIEPIDYRNEWPFDAAVAFAKAYGQYGIVQTALAFGEREVKALNRIQRQQGVLDALMYLNSKQGLAHRQAPEMLLTRIGAGDNYVGVDLEASWYARNLRIFANLSRVIRGPEDRVLVIFGQGHAPLLRQFVIDSPDLELVEPNNYLAQ